jgi:predicted nucleic-acid-binding protein
MMTGLDTNILVRYLTQDDPAQSAKAAAIMKRLTSASPGFVSVVAIAELAWVLDRSYGLDNREIAESIEKMLQVSELVIEREQQVFTAMVALKEGWGSFADGLIAALGARAGCASTSTFDRKAARLPGFALA